MALFLYRLGQATFRHRRLALGLWVLILAGSSLAAMTLKGPTSTSFSIPGTEAQQAIDTLLWVSTERAERSPRRVQRRSASAEHSSALPR